VDRILSHIPIIDDLLGGGFRRGYITEIAGSPWSLVKNIMHRILAGISRKYKVIIVYNQDFNGIDPYLLEKYSRLYKVPRVILESNIKIKRSFKPIDYISILKSINSEDIIFLVDPFLNVNNKSLYSEINSILRKFLNRSSTLIVFNRLGINGYPYGGHIHLHTIHYLITFKLINRNFVMVKLFKGIDIDADSLYVDLSSLIGYGKYSIQYSLSRWMI